MTHPEENKIMSDPEVPENPEPEPTRENVNPQSVEGLFLQALEKKTPAERTQFLDEMCGDNIEQRRRVEALLLAYEDAGSFLEKSPIGSSEPQPVSLEFLTPSDNTDLLGTLGEYDIYEVIGQGGMGIVFRALDPKLNRIVAIKVMSPHLAINPNARKRFLREAQAAAAVSHPHIVTIHAVDEDKLPYLVMEYVVGQSLQEKLDKVGSLNVTEILRIGNQIAEGLAAAHKQGLIHRDIKPANILLENGVERVKITDFGLARAVDDVTITKTGEVSGTPQYMSPEQTTGERVDQRSDLFSLGAVMYAMCTGRSPFRASNLAAVVRRVCDDTPRPIQEVNEEIPPWLIDIIDCLLEKRSEDRFQTAQEVAELLGAHLAIVQQPGRVPAVDRKQSPLRPRPTKSKTKHTSHAEPFIELKGKTPASLIGALLFSIGLGVFLAFQIVRSNTSGSVMTYDEMDRLIKFSFTLIFILSIASIVYWNRSDKKDLPFLTWFLSVLSLFLTLGLSFIATAVIRAAPLGAEFTSMHGSILAASVLGVLAVAGFALRCLWLHFSNQGSEALDAMKAKDSRVLTGIGIGIWVLLVLWNWGIATGIYDPGFLASDKWNLIPIVIFSLLGGMFVTAGFLLQRSLANGSRGQGQYVAVTSPYLSEQHDSQESGPQKSGSWIDRAAIWVGGLILLLPIFIGLVGVATGRHFAGNVPEMILVSVLFFGPVGLIVLICGAQNIVQPNSATAKTLDGIFLLACIFAGPLGILLYIARYIKRRDVQVQEKPEPKPVRPHQESITAEHKHSNKRIIIGVILGVVTLALMYLFAHAFRHLNSTEQYWVVNWGLKLVVVVGMFGAAYYIKRKGVMAAMSNPWNVMGWVTVLLACLFSFSMLMQLVAEPGSNEVLIHYDEQYPVTIVSTKSDKTTNQTYQVYSNPFILKLSPGEHALRISYSASGYVYSFTKNVKKIAGKQLKINLRPDIQRFVNDDKKKLKQERVDRKKKQGAILISGQESGLRVGVFPVDPMQARLDDGGFGYADRFFTFESLTHEVPAGKYIIRVSSELAGWEVDGGSPKYKLTEIEVKPGAIVSVAIQLDYAKLAESHPDWSKGGLFKFRWPVHEKGPKFMMYTLTLPQAEVVQKLLVAFVAGKPDVNELDLVETANKHIITKSYTSIKNLFNNGKHPAWGELIVSGKGDNTWRLIAPELMKTTSKGLNNGTVMIKKQDPGLLVNLLTTTDSSLTRKNDYVIYFSGPDKTFKVPEGRYLIQVTSENLGWVDDDNASKYLHSNIKVKPGVLHTVAISRDYQKLAKNHPDWTQSDVFTFGWPLLIKSDWPVSFASRSPKNYQLSRPQAKVVQQLFTAFAEGKPEVNESELLKTANENLKKNTYKSLKGLFDDGEHSAREKLFVSGKEKGTWRLREPK